MSDALKRRARPITRTMIGLRVGKLDKRQLQMAAEANGQTLSAFLRDAAVKEAYRTLQRAKVATGLLDPR